MSTHTALVAPGATQELWACTDKLLEPGQALAGAPTVPTSRGVGT